MNKIGLLALCGGMEKIATDTYSFENLRRAKLTFILASAAFGFTVRLSAAELPPDVFRPGETILFVGDSITHGGRHNDMNHYLGHGYQAEIAMRYLAYRPELHLQFENRGVSGDTSSNIVARWTRDAVPCTAGANGEAGVFGWKAQTRTFVPDVLNILAGVNDFHRQRVPADAYERNLRFMVTNALAAKPSMRIVVCEPFSLVEEKDPQFIAYQRAAARVAADCGCLFVPFQKLYSEELVRINPNVKYWFWDTCHPTYAAHMRMADFWLKTVADSPVRAAVRSERTVKMLPGENWWGLCNNFGHQMPFTEKTDFRCDLRRDNYGHQSLSLLVSDRGRMLYCREPVGAVVGGGRIRLVSDRGEIVLTEKAGTTLAEAYRFASRTYFPPTGEEPELLYFSAPQYNTWIELTYRQNEKEILAYAQAMLDHGLPPGVFMIDDTWQAGYGDWRFEPSRFADPKGMMDRLHAMGYKVLLWMCPFVSMDTPAYRRLQWGRNPDDVRGYPTKGGFLLSGADLAESVMWWNGTSALLDFTHPNAVAWFDEQLSRLVRDYGADGFKFDGGSVSSYTGARTVSGKPKAFDPSATAVRQSALYGDFALKYKGSEYRNVFGFAGKPVIMRLHDKGHTWKELRRIVPDMLAAGLVGCPFICPDMVGGGEWTCFLPGAPFSQELFIRSAQVQALSPMMQISASPWRVLDAEHQAIFKSVVALRQRFAPAFVKLARESARTGEPIMRCLEYAFPHRGYASVTDEFMMGDGLLVAPQMCEGAASRQVVLPPGRWQADDGEILDGPRTVTVRTPLERLPHFILKR